ncbi:MAG: serine--tRNA ligase [Patescibacteria group bacterium]
MLDIQYIREHANELKTAIDQKQFNPQIVDEVLRVDKERRELLTKVEELRKQSNEHNGIIKQQGKPTPEQIDKGKELKKQLQDLEPQLKHVEETFTDLMLQVPNPAAYDVPFGKDETGNQELFEWGQKRQFDFQPKTHAELAEDLDLFDSKRAVRIAGRRAYFLKNDLVLLEMAVQQFALKHMIAKGFTPMTVPWMVNYEALTGTGYFPWGKEDHYHTQDDQGLIGTAEVSLTAYYKDETLNEKDLPIKMVGISPCFRREVGSYGKDTQGFFRVHQFQKIEQVVYTVADEEVTRNMHDQMRVFAEEILQALNLPYHVLLMCTGDMGAGQRKKYDIETWFAGQNAYRETHSDSYFNDFQSRRLNIRYRAKDGSLKYVYTLNNTVAATPRLLGAIIENYQEADGTITIPAVLREFMGKEKIG